MPTAENNVVIKVKDSSGNAHLFYPKTKMENVDGLSDALSGKAASSHTHTIANVSGLQTALDGKAASSHGTHVSFSTTAPAAPGTASVGTATTVSRSDHVHPVQTTVSGNAGSATKLTTARTIDGVSFDGTAAISHFGQCSTAAATAAKTVSCSNFSLVSGAEITVKFTVTNTAANPTLNVNNTGAKPIYYRGSPITAGNLATGRTYRFVYDGTSYNFIGDINTDSTTSYETATQTSPGLMSADDKKKLDGITASADAVSFTASTTSGTKVGTITINGEATDMYAPSSSTATSATTAEKLKTARTIQANLASTSAASFDGSANVTPGVTGTLGLANGGTGATTAAAGRANLGATKVYWSASEPSDWTSNDVWFQIL